jgi:hypothetical protein
MQIKSIKVGRWYETKLGLGECLKSGGTFPPSVTIRIVKPIPRGAVHLAPRDVLREMPAPEGL